MTGEELKRKLLEGGYSITEVAQMMEMSQANFSAKLANDSVKTNLIEKLCTVLSKDLTFFYGGTKFLPITNISSNSQMVPFFLYQEIKKELMDAVRENEQLKNQISLMQQGKTIPQIAEREAG